VAKVVVMDKTRRSCNIMKLSGVVLEFEDFREGFFSSVANCHLELSNSVNEARCVW